MAWSVSCLRGWRLCKVGFVDFISLTRAGNVTLVGAALRAKVAGAEVRRASWTDASADSHGKI
ncbi:hypothetical protein RRSWK_03778 [Rhodopirellula sp. SWK7]|nr:hypothetical protein RRSWK_03778 [Rhodopirellula sp. SWK7]